MPCPFALDLDEAKLNRFCSEIEVILDPSVSKDADADAGEWGRITWATEESCLPLCQLGYWALTILQFTEEDPP